MHAFGPSNWTGVKHWFITIRCKRRLHNHRHTLATTSAHCRGGFQRCSKLSWQVFICALQGLQELQCRTSMMGTNSTTACKKTSRLNTTVEVLDWLSTVFTTINSPTNNVEANCTKQNSDNRFCWWSKNGSRVRLMKIITQHKTVPDATCHRGKPPQNIPSNLGNAHAGGRHR